jgi:transcriptional regulator GlxA family with amidase domain
MYDFTILLLPGAFAASVALTLDMLTAAAVMAAKMGVNPPRWRVAACVDEPTRLSNELFINAKRLGKRAKADNSIWVVPGLATNSAELVDARVAKADAQLAIKALRKHAQSGAIVAASCSAVFLLHAAGLLQNRKATTTWWLAAHLQNLEPSCKVDANRMVIADGNIWTAGAALAQTDLMLQLIRTRFGVALADAVARVLLIDAREAQAPFIIPAMFSTGHNFVAQLSQQIEAALPNTLSVADIAAKLCISERTLARRVKAATGQSTSALIQFVRLKRARQLLETSRMSVEQVSEQVGYRDATALRRLMRKVFAATPRQFRAPNRSNA